MKNTRTYRTEAPINHYPITILTPSVYAVKISAGRGEVVEGFGGTARAAYNLAASLYRFKLRHGWIVPAIIDENGTAL